MRDYPMLSRRRLAIVLSEVLVVVLVMVLVMVLIVVLFVVWLIVSPVVVVCRIIVVRALFVLLGAA